MWRGVVHTGFAVSDLERSVAWYTGVLGLAEIHRQRNDNAYTRQIVGMRGAVLDLAFLGFPPGSPAPGGAILELIQYRSPRGVPIDLATNNVGVGHLALAVDDLGAVYERLRVAGVHFTNPPAAIDAGINGGARACYLHDPDGITIELIQPRPRNGQRCRA